MAVDLIPDVPLLFAMQRRTDAFGGLGYLGGDTASVDQADQDGRARILNALARIDITVLEPITFTVVARTWSRPDGTWRVPYLDTEQQFTVIGTDRSKQVNSAIQDWVYPAPMDP